MRSFRRIVPLFVLAIFCAGNQLSPQSNPSPPEVTATPATAEFKSSTNLVQVPVIVRDSGGHAVGTLRAEDFQLSDGGKPQVISRFSVEKFDTTGSLQSQAKKAGLEGADRASSTERWAGTLPDRLVALLIDDVNLEPRDFVEARNAALHFIATLRADESRSARKEAYGRKFTGPEEVLRQRYGLISQSVSAVALRGGNCRP